MVLNKKGVSGVIVAVLMILIVIAAVVILWIAIKPFIEEGLEEVEGAADCLTLDLSIDEAWIETNEPDYFLKAKLTRNAGEGEIENVNFFIDTDSGESESVNLSPATGTGWPDVGETKVYQVTLEDSADADAKKDQTLKAVPYVGTKACDTLIEATVEDKYST